ncbi:hypothetical protein D3C86_1273660 [compost metagenome]
MEWLIGREVRLANCVLAVGVARDVRHQRFLLGGVLYLHHDDLRGHTDVTEIRLRIFLFGEIQRGRRLAAVDDLQPFEPGDALLALGCLAQDHLICHDHDAIVVGHEPLGCRA